MKNIAITLPLELTGSTFARFQQLSMKERKNVCHTKDALYVAFATDPFVAYKQFVTRCLNSIKSVDVYLADRHRLSTLYSRVFDCRLACVFVAGLPVSSGGCFALHLKWLHWMSTSG